MAPSEVAKLTKEIDARTRPSKAKAAAGRFTLTVQVTDALGTSASATTTVSAVAKPAILTARLPVAHQGKRFTAKLVTTGGAGPVKLRLAGATPKWLRLANGSARLAGTPKLQLRRTATYTVYLTAVDALGQRTTQKLRLIVKP
jgi:hypothetical protein